MSVSSLKILRRYLYDPLDRLTGVGLLAGDSTQRFYQENHLTTELGQQTQRTILRHEAQPLAQQQSEAGVTETTLLATDQAHSLLQTLSVVSSRQFAYTAYGHHPAESGLSRLVGFNGECPDAITGHYPLGQGNRFFNPALMRFNSPDKLGPFDQSAGINSYAYCGGDSINYFDPSGNGPLAFGISVIKKNPLAKIQPSQSTIANNTSPIPRALFATSQTEALDLRTTARPPLASTSNPASFEPVLSVKRTGRTPTEYKRDLRADAKIFETHMKQYPETALPKTKEISTLQDQISKQMDLLVAAATDRTTTNPNGTKGANGTKLAIITEKIQYNHMKLNGALIRQIRTDKSNKH